MERFADFICFKLGSAARKIQRYYNNKLNGYGITIGQAFILFSLLEQEGLNIKALGKKLNLDNSAMTGLVDRLEKENLVERRDDPEDRRAYLIFFTQKGKKMATVTFPIAAEFNARLKAAFDPEAQLALSRLLAAIEDLDV